MNQNGFNSFNNFEGPVFVDGDVDIDGNLDVTGTINGGGGGGVNNPMTSNLDCNSFSLTDCNNMEIKSISSSTSYININSTLVHANDVNMNNRAIYNINGTSIQYNGVDMKLDLCPATVGTASQILARDPAFNPVDGKTHKLVWQTPSAGFVTNPLSSTLIGNNNNLTTINSIDTKIITNTTQLTFSTPVFTINNGINLSPTAIGITGNITFTNPGALITAPLGLSLKVNDIYNDETTINVNTETYFIGGLKTNSIGLNFGYDLNITAPKTYLNGRLSNLFSDAKMGTRNVRTSLYKSYGNNTLVTDFNSLIPVSIDSINGPSIGIPVLVANTMKSGDKIKITLNCSLSTSAGGDMNIAVYMGTTYGTRKLQTAFIIPNTSTSSTTSIIEIELDCFIVNTVMKFDKVALLTMSKSNVSPRMVLGSITTIINELNPTQDNYIYIFGSVSTIVGIATINILGETIEHY